MRRAEQGTIYSGSLVPTWDIASPRRGNNVGENDLEIPAWEGRFAWGKDYVSCNTQVRIKDNSSMRGHNQGL